MIGRYTRVILAALPLAVAAFAWGGWATITMEDVPDHLVAGQPVDVEFTVRQHGRDRLTGLKAGIVARSGKLEAVAKATPGRKSGQYLASLTLPAPGEWTITIRSGFGTSNLTLLPLRVVAAGTQVAALPSTERGRRLFVAKGCVTCHTHDGVKSKGLDAAPDLTGRRLPAEYLSTFLADPGATRPARGDWAMPNLELKQQEIAALISFLNAESQAAAR